MFSIEEAMNYPSVKSVLNPGIKVLWGTQKAEDEIARSKPDTYTSHDYKVSFAAKKNRCMDLFASSVQEMVQAALLRDYDVIELYGIFDETPSQDANMYICDIGFRSINLVLGGTLVRTHMGAANLEKIRNDPVQQASIRERKLAPDTLLLPLAPMLDSPEAQTLLQGIKVHFGDGNVPASTERSDPEIYEQNASISKYGREGACKKAVLSALESMIDDVRDQKFNSLVRIRSYYKGLWAPDDQKVECNVAGKDAEIQLVATLAKLK